MKYECNGIVSDQRHKIADNNWNKFKKKFPII